MSRKTSVEEAREWLALNNPTISIMTDDDWGGSCSSRSWFTCSCGNRWRTVFHSIKRGTGCPRCRGGVRYDASFVESWLEENNIPIKMHDYKGNARDPSSWWFCTVCENLWHTCFTNIIRGSRCPRCSALKQHEQQRGTCVEATKFIREYFDNLSLLLYSGSDTVASCLFCSDCGSFFKSPIVRFKTHLRRGVSGNGCRRCRDIANAKRCTMSVVDAEEVCVKHDLELVSYGGTCSSPKTKVRCKKGHMYDVSINSISSGHGCPICAKRGTQHFFIDGKLFHSSWEAVCYLYYKEIEHSDVARIECGDPVYAFSYPFEGKSCTWYPDMVINGVVYEVKPDNGGRFVEERQKTEAKKEANRKNCYGVVFIGDTEIRHYRKCLKSAGIDYMTYRV